MVNYRKILEHHFNGMTQRTIEVAVVGSSRHTIRDVAKKAEEKELKELTEEMTDYWLEEFLFPEKSPQAKGYFQEDWDYVHKELSKSYMTLNTALGIVHQCGTFVHCMRAKSPPSAKIIVQLYNLLYTYFMYEFSYK